MMFWVYLFVEWIASVIMLMREEIFWGFVVSSLFLFLWWIMDRVMVICFHTSLFTNIFFVTIYPFHFHLWPEMVANPGNWKKNRQDLVIWRKMSFFSYTLETITPEATITPGLILYDLYGLGTLLLSWLLVYFLFWIFFLLGEVEFRKNILWNYSFALFLTGVEIYWVIDLLYYFKHWATKHNIWPNHQLHFVTLLSHVFSNWHIMQVIFSPCF